jgi:class I fructose-bisphosphate aldolase
MKTFDTVSSVGKSVRLNKILGNGDGKAVMLAMDHGIEHGPRDFPLAHLDPNVIIGKVVDSGVDAIMMPRGTARLTWRAWANKTALVIKLTGKTTLRPPEGEYTQDPIATVKDAVALGADGVSATVYWGAPHEDKMLAQFTAIAAECEVFGMPLLNLAYPRGPHMQKKEDVEIVRYAARAAAEVGADLIKTYYTGSGETFAEVVKACPVPVLMSGGAKAKTPLDFLKVVQIIMEAGAAGVVVGRNVFQHENPGAVIKAVMKVVHEGADAERASKGL